MVKPKQSPKSKNIEDALMAEATDAAAYAILERLMEFIGPNKTRAISTLNMEHLRRLASDAVAAYVKKRSEQVKENPDVIDALLTVGAPIDPDLNDDLPPNMQGGSFLLD